MRAINQTPPDGDPTTTLQVVVAIGSLESHQWALPVNNADFSDDPASGTATVSAPSTELGGYGEVNLTATPISPARTTQCADGSSMTVQDEAIQGSFDFATGSSAWGRLSGNPVGFAGNNQLVQEFGDPDAACFAPTPTGLTTCTPSIYWSAPYGANGTVAGGWRSSPHGTTGLVMSTNTVTVAAPGAPVVQRTDTDTRKVAIPVVTVWPTHSVINVAGQASQEVTGTATVKSSGPPGVSRRSCNGVTTTSRAFKASITPGAHPLTIRQAIGGPIVVSKLRLVARIRLVTGANENSFG